MNLYSCFYVFIIAVLGRIYRHYEVRFHMSIGKNIKMYRKQRRLTQVQLAEKAQLSRSYLADMEGDRYNPSVGTIKLIAQALQLDTSQLLDDTELESSHSANDNRDIVADLEQILSYLNNKALSSHGQTFEQEDMELLRNSLEQSLRLAKRVARQTYNQSTKK